MISSTGNTTSTTMNHNNSPPKQPEESVDKTLASTIYKLHPVTKCLKESLNECIESEITIHQSFQSKLLNKYGESMVQAYQNDMKSSSINTSSNNNTLEKKEEEEEEEEDKKDEEKVTGGEEAHCIKNGEPTIVTTADHTPLKAPAALLTGNIQHYNRYEGNWRIIISDAILRPRIDIPYTDKSEANARKRTLFEHSAVVEIEQRLKRAKTNEEPSTRMNPCLLPCIGDDGSIQLDGDIVILAYDDYVTSNKKK
jgi:hypothetical protein